MVMLLGPLFNYNPNWCRSCDPVIYIVEMYYAFGIANRFSKVVYIFEFITLELFLKQYHFRKQHFMLEGVHCILILTFALSSWKSESIFSCHF